MRQERADYALASADLEGERAGESDMGKMQDACKTVSILPRAMMGGHTMLREGCGNCDRMWEV